MCILNIYSKTKYKKLFYIILDTSLESIKIHKLINFRIFLSKKLLKQCTTKACTDLCSYAKMVTYGIKLWICI